MAVKPGKYTERCFEYGFLFNSLQYAPGPYLLDVGPGDSGIGEVIKHCGFAVDSIDIEPAGPGILKADIRESLVDSNSFDAVTCISTLEHIEGPEDAVDEMKRILKPGGVMILSCPYHLTLKSNDVWKGRGSTRLAVFNQDRLDSWYSEEEWDVLARIFWRQWTGPIWRGGKKMKRPARCSQGKAQGISIAWRKRD